MEESFELLSSMSPKVKGRQKTLKVKKASKLALKKHFRRSSIFDKSLPVNNEDLAIVELSIDSSESLASSKDFIPGKDKNHIVVIDSTDSEDEEKAPKKIGARCLLSDKTGSKSTMVQEWLSNVEERKKPESFFTQVSTILGDETSNFDNSRNRIAACSTLNDYVMHRFDELFINKKKDVKSQVEKDDITDDSFSLRISTSSASGTNNLHSNKNSDGEKSRNLELNKAGNNQIVINESLFTSDESVLKTPPKHSLKKTPIDMGFVTVRKNTVLGKKISPECPKTPSGQNVQEVTSLLDSFYGKQWRENQQSVLLPMSEPRKKKISEKKVIVPNTERSVKPKIKECPVNNVKPGVKKLNFDRLIQPVQSPWTQKLKGLVDSDSGTSENDSDVKNKKATGINMVKARLDFEEVGPKNSTKTKKNDKQIGKIGNNKENNPNRANKKLAKKPESTKNINTKKNTEGKSSRSSSSKSCSEEDVSTDEEYDKEIRILEIKRKSMMPVKHKTYGFLESLSGSVPLTKCDVSARIFRTSYKENKEQLAKKLFAFFNEKVFDNAIPKDSELEWKVSLRKTAGLCYCKKITHRSGKVERKVRIALSTKVLDSPDRLRDTLIHEMCHAVTWVVNQVSDGHGAYWKSWAFKAMETFPELPPIKRCHAYAINSKYTYKCTGCGYSFGRHSKSLNIERKRCGLCFGKFEVLLNKTTKDGETKAVAVTPRKEVTGFALFVKENYALYKEPSKKHGDVMRILGQKFAELKVKSTG